MFYNWLPEILILIGVILLGVAIWAAVGGIPALAYGSIVTIFLGFALAWGKTRADAE